MSEAVRELEIAISQFLSEHNDEFISSSRVVNPLLHIWKLANDLSPDAARPVGQLLTTLRGRKLVTTGELTDAMTQLREAVASLETPSAV